MPQYTEQSPELKFLLDLIFIEIHRSKPMQTDQPFALEIDFNNGYAGASDHAR